MDPLILSLRFTAHNVFKRHPAVLPVNTEQDIVFLLFLQPIQHFVQNRIQLFFRHRLHKVLVSIHPKSLQGVFPGCGEKDDPTAVAHLPQLFCRGNACFARHVDVKEQKRRRILRILYGVQQLFGVFKPVYLKIIILVAPQPGLYHPLRLVQFPNLIIADCYVIHGRNLLLLVITTSLPYFLHKSIK